jgi:hypothetical protein
MILIIVVIGRFFEGRTQVVTAQPCRTVSTNIKVNPPIPFLSFSPQLSRTSWISINPCCGLRTPYFQGLGDRIKFDFASPPARRMLAFWRYAPDPLAALKASY